MTTKPTIILTIFLSIILFSACHQNKYQIKGSIENGEGRKLVLEKMQLDRNLPIDSTELDANGNFTFRGDQLEAPTFFRLKLSKSNFITLLIDSTENINIAANAKNLEDTYELEGEGAIESKKIQILNQRLKTLQRKVNSLTSIYNSLPDEGENIRKNELGEEFLRELEEYKKFIGSFVMDNPRSFASYYALYQKLNDNTMVLNVMDKQEQVYFATIATSLNLLYPESPRVKHLYNYVLKAKEKGKRDRLIKQLEANAVESIPDINEKNINGEEIALSSLRGKVVLLSFWASWNENSSRNNKHLKKIYEQYNDKGFEIYQVSLDRSKVLWENAIVKDDLPWINVSDLRYTDSGPARLYNVRQLPANYLISREGDIIGKNLFGNMLKEKLEETL
ncbi:MAG: thioredoxin-like domain-containing protein [Bacteroidota bacterium]